MSLEATGWAFEQFIPDPASKLVLIALSDMTGDEYGNVLWDEERDIEHVASLTSMTPRQVRWAISALTRNHLLSDPYQGTGGQWFLRLNLGEQVTA